MDYLMLKINNSFLINLKKYMNVFKIFENNLRFKEKYF